jgi:small-conductance mechanosensitive channel
MTGLTGWVEPGAVFAIALAIALLVRYLLLRSVSRAAAAANSLAEIFQESVRWPSLLWALAAAIASAVEYLPPHNVEKAHRWIGAVVIVSLTLAASTFLVRTVAAYAARQGVRAAGAGLSLALVRVVVFALGGTWLLLDLGWSKGITPLLTAFGVGGLAVALALQDTLANFFAGIHILVERPIFVGDTIRLEGGQEGVVTDIGWRTTRIRTASNDMIVAPNVKITSGILVNFNLPTLQTAAEVLVLASNDADPDLVRGIALEEAADADGVLAEPAPLFLCDPGVLATHLQCKLIFHVRERSAMSLIQSEVRMRILNRFRAEGVPLPHVAAPAPQI